jgi:DMSO reductase family type II enzyme chaperone
VKQDSAAEAALCRSGLYVLLARTLSFPQPELHHEAVSGRLHHRIGEALEGLPYRLAMGPSRDWRPVGDYEAFQSEYIRLFEVGPQGRAICPLHSGHHGSDRLHTMEELVRFYNYFGLRMTPGRMPDHVTVELEFMHYLAHQEAEARQSGGDRESYLRAQRDFLERHLNNWWPLAVAAIEGQRPQRFYRSLMTLIRRFLAAEGGHVASALSAGPSSSKGRCA